MRRNFSSSLKDLHGRRHNYLRISLTEKCNLRCQYCMPAEGVPLSPHILTQPEIFRLATLFKNLGVNKVRLTGGEPTVRQDLVEIVSGLKILFSEIGMTTNGTLLKRKLPLLKDAGLTHLNVSLDSLVAAKNEFITRRPNTTDVVLRSIEQSISLGIATKLNVVAMKNFNEDELCDFIELGRNQNLAVRFIEFMPFGLNDWKHQKFVSMEDMLKIVKIKYPEIVPLAEVPSATSRDWKIPGFVGSFGFISSMSNHFCGSCNRLRITADGCLKVCLFDNREINLKQLMQDGMDDEQLTAQIQQALNKKHFSHGGVDSILQKENRPMVRIGG